MNKLSKIIEKEGLTHDRETLNEINNLLKINNKTEDEFIQRYIKKHKDMTCGEMMKRKHIIEEVFTWLGKN